MDTFTRQYIETALWSSTDFDGNPLDDQYDADDLAPETLKQMIEDCKDFQEHHSDLWDDDSRAGHDFWLTRNRHGAGFWDGDYPEPQASKLTDASHAYGSCDLYPGDDGKLYLCS